jgi:HSP20 family protein
MNQPAPAPRRRPPERWRSWPRDLWDRDPFGDFAQLWNRMSQAFESGGPGGQDTWVPAVETEETSDAYLVRAELPGMKSDDVDVELNGNELRITGEVNEETTGKTLRHRHGKFAYRTTLPAGADADKIDAQLADGILTVRVPKAAQAQSRRIEVKADAPPATATTETPANS